VLAVLTPSGQQLDTRAMVLVARAMTDHSWATQLLSHVSAAPVVMATIALVALAAVRRRAGAALAVAMTCIGTVVAAQVLKAVLARPTLLGDGAANSLPSGHVAAVAGLAVAAVFAVPRKSRATIGAVGVAAVALTGVATVTLEWHRPSDVLAGALLAIIAGALAQLVAAGRSVTRPGRFGATNA
jgi:membrane-associated phospholipid phosphatase